MSQEARAEANSTPPSTSHRAPSASKGSHDTRSFHFVNTTGSTKPDEDSRPFIRSYVMREENRRPYNQDVLSRNVPERSNSSAPTPRVHRFRFGSTYLRSVPIRKNVSRQPSPEGRLRPTPAGRGVIRTGNPTGATEIRLDLPRMDGDSGPGQNANAPEPLYALDSSSITHSHSHTTSQENRSLIAAVYQQSSRRNSPEPDSIHPVDTLPIPQSQRTQELLHRYQTNSISCLSSIVGPEIKSCFDLFIEDAAFCCMILCIAAGDWILSDNVGDTLESLYWKNEAIKIVNMRLDESSNELEAGTIAAVASLVSYEATNGSPDSARTHLCGLKQIIDAIGGFGSIKSPPLLCMISRADIDSACALSTPLRFPDVELSIQSFHIPSMSSDNTYQQVADIFVHVRRLCDLMEEKYASNPDKLSPIETLRLIRRQFISFLTTSEDQQHNLSSPERICCIAGLIFVKSVICRADPNSEIIRTLLTRLEAAISAQDFHTPLDDARKIDFILWSIYVGAITVPLDRRGWYVQRLVANNLVNKDWQDVRRTLQQLSFPGFILEHAVRPIWEEALERIKA